MPRGGTRNTSAVTRIARKQAVPDAASQLSSYSAGYGAGEVTTGGMRVIML